MVVTGLRDDSVGGDTNNDGVVSAPARGNWLSLFVEAGGRAELAHMEVRYTNAGPVTILLDSRKTF